MAFKYATQYASTGLLVLGYSMEGIAFVLYPFTLQHHPMRVVSGLWAANSVLVSLVVGLVAFNERPSALEWLGGALSTAGVLATVIG